MKKIQWSTLKEEDCLKQQGTSLAGLSSSDIVDRLSIYGKNILPSKKN